MNCFQAFNELEKVLPELDDINTPTRRCFFLEIFFKGSFISILEQDVEFTSMDVAAVESEDTVLVLYAAKTIDFSFVRPFTILGRISFENECVDVGIVY
jgi:hypothetical protein